MRLGIATGNPNKVREIKDICKGMEIEFTTLPELPSVPVIVEDGTSFRENALKKAGVLSEYTNELSIGDDSGLEVEYLNGRPGIRSSRYAGEEATDEDNNRKLIDELNGVPDLKRKAAFRCVIALVGADIKEVFEGECTGIIASKPSGKNGFGYDPIFYLPHLGKTMAELTPDAKNSISHRTKALHGLINWLTEHK